MQILSMLTLRADIRADVQGWTYEDVHLYRPDKPIGLTPSPIGKAHYTTVMAALAAGWKLLGPPQYYVDADLNGEIHSWDWWLTKEDEL